MRWSAPESRVDLSEGVGSEGTAAAGDEALPDPAPVVEPSGTADLPHTKVRFAHNSEFQFAKLLDFYGLAWEYEPRTFVLEWDKAGKPAQAFTPDFYLPEYDKFIEITTLNQRLVTKKNRKARRLRELHPEVDIQILYQRDYLNLLVKYGLEPPSHLAPLDGSVEPLPLRFEKSGLEKSGFEKSHDRRGGSGTDHRGRRPA